MKPKPINSFAAIALASAFTTTLHAATGTWTGAAAATWDTTATNWSGVAGTPWDAANGVSNLATFNTLGATPAVSGTVYTNGISFSNTATVSGGTINLAGATAITTTTDATIGSIIDGTLGLAKAGANKLTLTGANTYTGATAVNAGNLTISGTGAITSAGNLTVSPSASATYSSSATSTLATVTVGTGSSATATFSQSAGTINASVVNLATGQNGNGNYNLSGTGTLALTGALGIGTRSGVNWNGVFSLSGTGTLTASSINVAPVSLGGNSFGRLDISGGTATSASNLNLTTGSPSDSTGRVAIASLRGGRLAVNGVNTGTFSGNAFSAAVLNFAGGTLVANAANTNFISGLTVPYVYGGAGANFDTNGNDITISKNLQGTSGNGVTGVTALTGGSGYTISTSSLAVTFSAPDLSPGKAAQGFAITNASGVVTNIIVTDPGTGYSAAPTITYIFGGGTGAGATTTIGPPTNITTTGGGLGKKGLGKLTLSGTNTFIGPINLDNGSLSVSGNHSAATGGIILRGYGDSGSTYNTIASTADLETTSSVTVDSTKTIQAGNTGAGGGFQLQTLNANGPLTNDGTLFVGRSGRVNVGGTWTQNGSTTVATQGGGIAVFTVNPTGSFTYTSASDFILHSSGSSNTTSDVVVDGGTFTTGTRIHNDTVTLTATSSSRITLKNAGTLTLSSGIADLFTTDGANRTFLVDTGGGVVNTNSFSTTLNVPVSGTGGITKSGGGTLTLAELNTYSGDTTVSAGTLSLSQVNVSNETSTVSIASGAFLNLTFGGTDTVDKLFLNGVQQNAGVYGSGNSGGRITGTGTLTVTTGPVAAGYASWIDDFGLALADQDPTDDPDNDGMNNLLEFVLNGNPSVSDSSILPGLNVTATDFEFTYQRRDDSVSPQTTQTFQWGTTLATWPGSAVIPAGGGTVGAATITVSPGTPNDAVTDTVKVRIPKTEAGGSGKLFGRLQVVKP